MVYGIQQAQMDPAFPRIAQTGVHEVRKCGLVVQALTSFTVGLLLVTMALEILREK